MNLGSAEERFLGEDESSGFRVSGVSSGLRKKKRKISEILYKFVCGIKKV